MEKFQHEEIQHCGFNTAYMNISKLPPMTIDSLSVGSSLVSSVAAALPHILVQKKKKKTVISNLESPSRS